MAYTKLTWMQIAGMLRSNGERTDFTVETERLTMKSQEFRDHMKFDQIEDASYAININIDVDLAYKAIRQGQDLTGCLAYAQVEFCS